MFFSVFTFSSKLMDGDHVLGSTTGSNSTITTDLTPTFRGSGYISSESIVQQQPKVSSLWFLNAFFVV